MITLLVMTNGRDDLLAQTLARFEVMVDGPITRRIINNDSGNRDHHAWLRATYEPHGYTVIGYGPPRGFGGAIAHAWNVLDAVEFGEYVFHLEDDFLFNRTVDLNDLIDVMEMHPHLAQMAFRRQAWNEPEIAAGGVIEQHPYAYSDVLSERSSGERYEWLMHRQFFTTNPSLYRRELCRLGWPTGKRSEGVFWHERLLVDDPDAHCGYWGKRDDPPWVEHIGHRRTGSSY